MQVSLHVEFPVSLSDFKQIWNVQAGRRTEKQGEAKKHIFVAFSRECT